MGKIERIEVPGKDWEGLRRLARDRHTPQKRIVLLAGEGGKRALELADEVGVSVLTERRWRRRYQDKGVDGLLKSAARLSRVKPLSPETIPKVVDLTLHSTPPGWTHWSLRKMAKAVGVSPSAVQRIRKAHGLKPHLTRNFWLSRDFHFNEKVADIVGLYLNPPDKALVLSVDEKGLIQALDVASGKVIGECMNRHRHQEFIRFLPTKPSPRRLPQRCRPRSGYRELSGAAEHEAFRQDRRGRRHPQKSRPCDTSVRVTALDRASRPLVTCAIHPRNADPALPTAPAP